MKRILFLLLILLASLSACQNIGEDVEGTLSAGDVIMASEAARVAQDSLTRATQAAATVAAARTDLAAQESINNQLFLTLAAGSTPTRQLEVVQVDPAQVEVPMDDMMANDSGPAGGGRLFTQTGVSTAVSSTDGCVVNPSNSFLRGDLQQLYATARVFNASGAIEMRAEWYQGNELITSDNWTIRPDRSPYCFWYVVDNNDTSFPPGSWSVRMFADGFELPDVTTTFTIDP